MLWRIYLGIYVFTYPTIINTRFGKSLLWTVDWPHIFFKTVHFIVYASPIGRSKWPNWLSAPTGNAQRVKPHSIWRAFRNCNTRMVRRDGTNKFNEINFLRFSECRAVPKEGETSASVDGEPQQQPNHGHSSNTKLYACSVCKQNLYLTNIDILKHKKKCK